MSIYKFKIGEMVFLKPSRNLNNSRGAYTVIRKLPEHDGEFEYRVRSSYEEHERVVRESQMRALAPARPSPEADERDQRVTWRVRAAASGVAGVNVPHSLRLRRAATTGPIASSVEASVKSR